MASDEVGWPEGNRAEQRAGGWGGGGAGGGGLGGLVLDSSRSSVPSGGFGGVGVGSGVVGDRYDAVGGDAFVGGGATMGSEAVDRVTVTSDDYDEFEPVDGILGGVSPGGGGSPTGRATPTDPASAHYYRNVDRTSHDSNDPLLPGIDWEGGVEWEGFGSASFGESPVDCSPRQSSAFGFGFGDSGDGGNGDSGACA